jgi:predicted nucleic acid-binding protein
VIVVSNTSPIVNLAGVGRLDLLQLLYEEVFIPQAVKAEILARVRARGGNSPDAASGKGQR